MLLRNLFAFLLLSVAFQMHDSFGPSLLLEITIGTVARNAPLLTSKLLMYRWIDRVYFSGSWRSPGLGRQPQRLPQGA